MQKVFVSGAFDQLPGIFENALPYVRFDTPEHLVVYVVDKQLSLIACEFIGTPLLRIVPEIVHYVPGCLSLRVGIVPENFRLGQA